MRIPMELLCLRRVACHLGAVSLLVSLYVEQASAQLGTPASAQDSAHAMALQGSPDKPHTLVEIHRRLDNLALRSRQGDAQAIAQLSQTVFQRVGVPPEVADSFHFTQRLAQAETDYRNGVHASVHEEDLVRAHNNLAHTLGAPEWAYTSQLEVRRLRMQFMARYPQLLANQAPPDQRGHFQALGNSIGPIEAAFLATSLVYQKIYNREYQLSAQEQAAGGAAALTPAVFQQRN